MFLSFEADTNADYMELKLYHIHGGSCEWSMHYVNGRICDKDTARIADLLSAVHCSELFIDGLCIC